MSAIAKALSELKFRIPLPILEAVFTNRFQKWRNTPISLDEAVMTHVIRPRVLYDCNLIGGTEVFISLNNVPQELTDDFTSIYRIPKDRTNGRSIMSVLNVTFSDPTRLSSLGVSAGIQSSPMMLGAEAMIDAMGSMPVTSTSQVQLIGENVIMVRETMMLPSNLYLRCILTMDENLNHIQVRSYHPFAQMVTLAVKSYIYNEYVIRMDQGELFAGMTLGKFKEIIEEYKESEELYQLFMKEKMQKIFMMNDHETMRRLLRRQIGSYR